MCLKCLMVIWVWGHLTVNILSQGDPPQSADHSAIATPKGKGPPCVPQRGQTFCENVPGYPYGLILNALRRSNFDITKFLVDESTDDTPNFSSMRAPPTTRPADRRISGSASQANSGNVPYGGGFRREKENFGYT